MKMPVYLILMIVIFAVYPADAMDGWTNCCRENNDTTMSPTAETTIENDASLTEATSEEEDSLGEEKLHVIEKQAQNNFDTSNKPIKIEEENICVDNDTLTFSLATEVSSDILPKRLINEVLKESMAERIFPQKRAIDGILNLQKTINKTAEIPDIQAHSVVKKIFLNMDFLSNNFRAKINKSIQKFFKKQTIKDKSYSNKVETLKDFCGSKTQIRALVVTKIVEKLGFFALNIFQKNIQIIEKIQVFLASLLALCVLFATHEKFLLRKKYFCRNDPCTQKFWKPIRGKAMTLLNGRFA